MNQNNIPDFAHAMLKLKDRIESYDGSVQDYWKWSEVGSVIEYILKPSTFGPKYAGTILSASVDGFNLRIDTKGHTIKHIKDGEETIMFYHCDGFNNFVEDCYNQAKEGC